MHWGVVNMVVVWLQILGPYWCTFVALFGGRLSKGVCIPGNNASKIDH